MKKIKFACLTILPKKKHTLDTVVIYTVLICIVSFSILGYLIYNDFFSIEGLEIKNSLDNTDSVEYTVSIKITEIDDKFQFIFVETEVEKVIEEDLFAEFNKPKIIEEEEEEVIHTVEEYNQIVIDEKDIPIPEVLIKFREEEAEKLKEKVDLVFIEYVYSIYERVDENLGHIIKIMFDISYEELMNFICSIDSYFIDCLNSFKNENLNEKFIYKLNNIYYFFYNFIMIFFFFFFFLFSIHTFFSLYSVYVDYFQKTSMQSISTTGFIPVCIILILLFFIFFCIFYYFFKLYYIKVLWLIFL